MYSPQLHPLIVRSLYQVKQMTGLPITTLAEMIIAEVASRYGNAEAKDYIRQYLNVNNATHSTAKRILNQRDRFKSWKKTNRSNNNKPKEPT